MLKPLTLKDFRQTRAHEYGSLWTFRGFNLFLRQFVYVRRAVVEHKWRAFLPMKRPADVDRKVWLVITKVWELWGEGYRWPTQEVLLEKVSERLSWDPKQDLSKPTVGKALEWMRKENYIDL